MILVKSRLRSVPFRNRLKNDVQKILNALGYGDFDVGILLTTDKTIRKYNNKYRNKDKATNVLSFSFYPEIKPGQKIVAEADAEKNLGDIIISVEHIKSEAKKLGISFNQRLRQIIVHAVCHLLGYTHDTEKEYMQMKKKEQELLSMLA